MIKKMVGDDLTLALNSKIALARLPPCFSNLLPHIYRVNHRLAFDKRADEPSIEARNPYQILILKIKIVPMSAYLERTKKALEIFAHGPFQRVYNSQTVKIINL